MRHEFLINPRLVITCLPKEANTRHQKKPEIYKKSIVTICGFFDRYCTSGFYPATDIGMIFSSSISRCTSASFVSRKKILTITYPSAQMIEAAGTGSFVQTSTLRTGQILLSQPVVTNHNSFSGFPRMNAEFTNRGLPTAQPFFPVSGSLVPPFAKSNVFLVCHIDRQG